VTRLIKLAPILLLLIVIAMVLSSAQAGEPAGEIILKPESPECIKRIAAYSQSRRIPLRVRPEQGSYIVTPAEVGEVIEIAVEIDEQHCYMEGFRDEIRLLEYSAPRLTIEAANYTMTFTILAKKFKTVYVTVIPDPPYCLEFVRSDSVSKADGKWLVGPYKVGEEPVPIWFEIIPSHNCSFSGWSPSPLTSSNPHSTSISGYIDRNLTLVASFQPMPLHAVTNNTPPPVSIMLIDLLRENYLLLVMFALVAGAGVAVPKVVKLVRKKRRVDWLNITLQYLEREADAKAPWIGLFTRKVAFKEFKVNELVEGLEVVETSSEHPSLLMFKPSTIASLHKHLADMLGGTYAMVADKVIAGLCAYYGIAPFTRAFASAARTRVEEIAKIYRKGGISVFQAINALYEFLVEWAASEESSRTQEAVSREFEIKHGRLPKIPGWADDIMSLCANVLRTPRAAMPKAAATGRQAEGAGAVELAKPEEVPKPAVKPSEISDPLKRRIVEYAAANIFYNPLKEEEELEKLAARLRQEVGADIGVAEAKTLLRRAVYELRANILEGRIDELKDLPTPREILELEPDEIMLYAEGCDPVKLYRVAEEAAASTDPEQVASEKAEEVVYEGISLTEDLKKKIEAAIVSIAERIREKGPVRPSVAEAPAAEAVGEEARPERLTVKWVEEGEIGRLCPLCGAELTKTMEGAVCYSCKVIYKIKRVPVASLEEEEAWALKIPEEVVRDPGVKLVILRDYPYNLPASFTVKCEGFEATVYREPARRGVRAEEFMETLIKSIERDAQTGRCSVIAVTRPGTDPWSRKAIYLERVINLASTLAHSPHLVHKLRLVIIIPEETIFFKDVAGELKSRLRELNVDFQEYSVELPYEEVLEVAKEVSVPNPEQAIHLLRAFPKILRHLKRGKPLDEAVRIELASEGEDVRYIADVVEKFCELGRRLTEEEVKEVIGVSGVAWVKLQTLKALDLVG